jgi:uncharacterized membrane protein
MRIRNPLLLNDWEIRKTLEAVVLIQAAVLLSLCLAYLGFGIPIIQVPISFAYLTFIPGILLLRVLRLHELGNVRTLLYSMGLSLSLLMAAGVVLNTIFLRIGFANPMSLLPLAVAMTSLVLVLSVFSYVRDREFSNPVYVNLSSSNLSPQVLLLCLLPFLTVFATFLMNYYGTNSLQMILLLIIMTIPFVAAFGWVSEKQYAFVLWIVSFSLLFYTSLISQYVWGADVNGEVFLARSVLQSGVWNLPSASNFAGMLSVMVLAPIYSLFSNLSPALVFKFLYPFIFSFVPLGLYTIFKKQTSDKVAFFSCFYFMAFWGFFVIMPSLGKQEIAELFLVLIVLLVVDNRPRIRDRSLLMIIFGAGLSVSHYGTTYVFLIILALALPITYIALPKVSSAFKTSSKRGNNDIKIFAAFFAVFSLGWYLYVSPQSGPFVTVLAIGNSVVSNVNEMFTPAYSQPVTFLTSQTMPLQIIERDIFLLSFFFILVGLVAVLLERKQTQISREFMGFACGSFVFLFLATALPLVAGALQSDRIIGLSFIFLAPFCIIGLIRLLGLLSGSMTRVVKRVDPLGSHKKATCAAVSVFLVIFFIFNSAFIYQLFDQPKSGRFALDNNVDFLRLNEQELANAVWLSKYQQNGSVAYADVNKATLIWGLTNPAARIDTEQLWSHQLSNNDLSHSYIFLGSYNLENKEMLIVTSSTTSNYVPTSEIPQASVISNDGGSMVLWVN